MSHNVLIVGSCVSRDAFEVKSHSFHLTNYIARSSFASSFSEKPFPFSIDELATNRPSPWNVRMAEYDINKKLPFLMREFASVTDTILVDLIDERLPLIESAGAIATYPLIGTERLQQLPVRIFDRTEVFPLWMVGFSRFMVLAKSLSIPVILNRAYWAHKQDNGEAFPAMQVDSNNKTLQRMYDHIDKNYGIPSIDYPDAVRIASSNHKWSTAPFHYIPTFYEHTLQALATFMATCAHKSI